MKKLLKAAALSCFLIITCFGFYAFKKYQEIKTSADVFRSLIYSGIYSYGYNDTQWPDSAMVVNIPANWDTSRMVTKGPLSLCGSSPAYFYRFMAEGIGAIDPDNGYSKESLVNFKQAFGKDLMAAQLKTALKNYDKSPVFMNQFKADALKAAFDQLYKKPTDDFDGFALQKIYDIAAKDYFRSCATVVADVMKKKALFAQLATAYKSQALTNKNFYGPSAAADAEKKLLGKDYSNNLECIRYGADRILGMMMRRQIDGSLQVLLTCVKTVLKDYDPEFYTTIEKKF
ncbi:MAG: hypothetical protein ABIX01_17460 [Chitinophagaceae bacterium]